MAIRLILIFTFSIVLIGCQSNTTELKQSNPIINVNPGNDPEVDELIKTINEYYNLEKNELWDKAYEHRTPLFRKSVLKDDYVKQMSKDNKGWQLFRFEIVDIKTDKNRATAKMKFTVESPREIEILRKKEDKGTIEENTKWIKYGDTWFTLDPGSHTHFALNTELVKE